MTLSSPATLPPYSGEDARCPKCSNEGASTTFLSYGNCSHGIQQLVIGHHPNERLHRECRNCSYTWDEQTREQMCSDPDHLPEECRHCKKRGESKP